MFATLDALLRKYSALIKYLIYFGGPLPGILLFYWALNDQLGADPVKTLEKDFGIWALRFLIAALAVTPLRELTGLNLMRFRRAFGLMCFFYAAAHFSIYLAFDRALDLTAIFHDIQTKLFISIGLAAFLTFAPLALTSHDRIIRAFGFPRWKNLQRAIYLAASLAILHFALSVKSWPPDLLIYGAIVLGLLSYRVASSFAQKKTA